MVPASSQSLELAFLNAGPQAAPLLKKHPFQWQAEELIQAGVDYEPCLLYRLPHGLGYTACLLCPSLHLFLFSGHGQGSPRAQEHSLCPTLAVLPH